jgi:tetratricopeptide (TPR) repeat protein
VSWDDSQLARAVVERGLARADQLEPLLARRRQGDPRPLVELIAATGIVARPALEAVIRGAGPGRSEDLRPTVAAPPPSRPSARVRGVTDPAAPVPERLAAREALERALRTDPLFSPLAEIALARERILGEGGMGVVELVTDRRLGRRAALKLMKSEERETSVKRFRREALITARLDHPGIPPVYEAGRTTTGQHFLLMRFVDGKSLDAILKASPKLEGRELSNVLSMLVKVGEAVAYAHSRRIVHRDLKPANIMVGSFGEVLVMDWGLARNLDESRSEDAAVGEAAPPPGVAGKDMKDSKGLTMAGATIGTVGYMPPEQAKGEDVDERADVFALGAVLVEVLTGLPPIEGESYLSAITATIEGQVVLPRARRPDTPPELEAIARRALAPRREDRYTKVRDLTDDLRAFVEGRDVSVYRYGPLEQALRLARRHPAPFAAALVTILASGLASAALGLKNVEIGRKSDEITRKSAELLARNAEIEAKSAEVEAKGAEIAAKNAEIVLKNHELLSKSAEITSQNATLQATVDALEAEKKGRQSAEDARQSAEDARHRVEQSTDLLAEARSRFEAGAPPDVVVRLVESAVAARRTEAVLLEAARLLVRIDRPDPARKLLQACADESPPGYAALFMLHDLDVGKSGFKMTDAIRELIKRAQARGEENEFTALATSFDAIGRGDFVAAAAAAAKAAQVAPRLGVAHAYASEALTSLHDIDKGLAEAELAVQLDPEDAVAWNARGFAHLTRSELDLAQRDFDRAVSLDPGGAFLIMNRGVARLERNDLEGASADFETALKMDDGLAVGHADRASLRLQRNDMDGAAADAERAIQLDPKCAIAYVVRGQIHLRSIKFDMACADFDKAVELDPGLALAWACRGNVKAARGDLTGALADCDKGVLLDGRSALALSLRANVKNAAGDFKGAIADGDHAIAIDATSITALFARANARAKLADLDGAIADATRAIELSPQYGFAWLLRAEWRRQKGEYQDATQDAEKAVALIPGIPDAWGTRAWLRLNARDYAGCRSDCDRALALDQGNINAHVNRAVASIWLEDWDAAITDADKAIALDARSALAYNARGRAHLDKGELDRAVLDLEKAIELDPKMAIAYGNRAEALSAKGDAKGAAADANKAVELGPGLSLTWKSRGFVRLAKKSWESAIADFAKAIELDAKFEVAYRGRGEAHQGRGDNKAAIADFQKFLELAPRSRDAAAVKARLDKLKVK